MSTNSRWDALLERKDAVQRELQNLAETKNGSANTALADLEAALSAELDRIDRQMGQIRAYVDQCRGEPEVA